MKLKIIGVIFSIFLIIFTIPVIGTEYADFTNKNLSIIVGPYPQSPDIDSIIIIWMTSIATSNNSVHFGLTPVCENIVYDNDTNDEIAGASVWIDSMGGTTTDHSGYYEIDNILPGPHTTYSSKQGSYDYSSQVTVIAETTIDITDSRGSKELLSHLQDLISKAVPQQIEASIISAHKYTIANAETIKQDLFLVLGWWDGGLQAPRV